MERVLGVLYMDVDEGGVYGGVTNRWIRIAVKNNN